MDGESLDLRGLKCPLPALLTRKRLERMAPGALLAVVADDPMAPVDLPHMCRTHGFDVVEVAAEGALTRMVLRRL